jgi:hypothetical protein
MTFLSLSIFLAALLVWGPTAQEPINRFLGIGPRVTGGRSATIRILALLVVIALVLVIDPEIRLFLAFIDAVGVDFFLLLLVLQGRDLFALLHGTVISPAVHYLAALGPYPLPLPGRWFFTQHPFWAVYSLAQFVTVTVVIGALFVLAIAGGASAAIGSTGKALSGALLAIIRPKGCGLLRELPQTSLPRSRSAKKRCFSSL